MASPSYEPMNITLPDDAGHDVIFTMLDVHLKYFFLKRCDSELKSSRAQDTLPVVASPSYEPTAREYPAPRLNVAST